MHNSRLSRLFCTCIALVTSIWLVSCSDNNGHEADAGFDADAVEADADEIDSDAEVDETDADEPERDADENEDDADIDQDEDLPPVELSGPPCPEPTQAPINESWPEVFVGVEGCDDEGAGTEEAPFCTFTRAFEVADSVPYVVTILDGEYRITDDPSWTGSYSVNRQGTADEYFVLRAAEGAQPVILASIQIPGTSFEEGDSGVWRVSSEGIPNSIKGLWTSEGRRILHLAADGGVTHANATELVEQGTWTLADADGTACLEEDHSGCFIYMIPPAEMNVAETSFEVSQSAFLSAVTPAFMWIEGITVFFTQSTAIFFENTDHVVIQRSHFAHNVNSVDNAYGLHLWDANGTIVRDTVLHDSRYWRGAVNSHGITFMVAGDEEPNWVCNNEVFDVVGGCVSSKGGVSNLNVVGNYLHDCGQGVRIPDTRCHWRGCDEHLYPGGNYTIRENLFVNNQHGVEIEQIWDEHGDFVYASRIFNNTFIDTQGGIHISRLSRVPEVIRNNISVGSGSGLLFQAGGTATWPDYYLDNGLDSDFNFFGTDDGAVYVIANWSGLEQAYSLEEYRAAFASEVSSLSGDPLLDGEYVPLEGSPTIGTGDPSVYEDAGTVDMGMWPNPR